ncbi:hypothetical protein GmHk_12G035030 [Glycine max]|nr:hypothetical protein GmHk_12G035030 [Glycine max]
MQGAGKKRGRSTGGKPQAKIAKKKTPDYMKPDTETYNWVIQAYTRVESYASLCVIGLTPSHIAFKDEGGITAVDFNVGKSDCSGIKVIGKRKKVRIFLKFEFSHSPSLCFSICMKN